MMMDKDSEEYKEFRRKANERNRRYYSKPEVKAKKKIYKKEYDLKNKENISKYGYQLRSRPETQERIRRWREAHKEHLRLQNKEWRTKNHEYKLKIDRDYYYKLRMNPENVKKERERAKVFRKEKTYLIRGYYRKYYNSPGGKLNYYKHNHRRLSLIHKCGFNLTSEQIKQLYERDKVCVYCGATMNLTLDHVIALANGGDCSFNNYVVSCQKCNSSKGKKDVIEWCKEQNIKIPEIVCQIPKYFSSNLGTDV